MARWGRYPPSAYISVLSPRGVNQLLREWASFLECGGEESNLADTPELWCVVRTKGFKAWFGDWDTLARIKAVQGVEAVATNPHESLDKNQMKAAFKAIGIVANKYDNINVRFPSSSVGKIRGHRGLIQALLFA